MSCNWNLNTFDPLTESHLPLTSSLPRDFDMICFELALSKKTTWRSIHKSKEKLLPSISMVQLTCCKLSCQRDHFFQCAEGMKACLWPRTRKAISHHCRLEFKTHPRLDSVALHARTS